MNIMCAFIRFAFASSVKDIAYVWITLMSYMSMLVSLTMKMFVVLKAEYGFEETLMSVVAPVTKYTAVVTAPVLKKPVCSAAVEGHLIVALLCETWECKQSDHHRIHRNHTRQGEFCLLQRETSIVSTERLVEQQQEKASVRSDYLFAAASSALIVSVFVLQI